MFDLQSADPVLSLRLARTDDFVELWSGVVRADHVDAQAVSGVTFLSHQQSVQGDYTGLGRERRKSFVQTVNHRRCMNWCGLQPIIPAQLCIAFGQ